MRDEITFARLVAAMRGGGLHLLNTSIIPPKYDGHWVVETIPPQWALSLVRALCHDGSDQPINHIGHAATAALAGQLWRLGELQPDRTPWDGAGLGLAIQLRGRIAEGAILDREELDRIGYDIRVLYRLAEDGLPADAYRPGVGSAPYAEALRTALDAMARITFLRRKDSYYGANISGAEFDAGEYLVRVLADPVKRLAETPHCGYSGSSRGDNSTHNLIMVWVGSASEGEALNNLCRQIGAALGWPEDRVIGWEVL